MGRRIVSLALCLAWLAPAFYGAGPAEAKGGPEGMRKWWNSPRMVTELHLTPAEKGRLDELFVKFQQDNIKYRAEASQARLEIEAAFDKEPLEEARALDAFKRVEQAKTARGRAAHAFMLEVRRLLGRDRYQRLKELFEEFKARPR